MLYSRPFLNSLKMKIAAKTVPAYLTVLTNKTSLETYLNTCPDLNGGITTYLNSLVTDEFNDLLSKWGLPRDIYKCNDTIQLMLVLDELVNDANRKGAAAALKYGKRSCRPALCYFLRYLLGLNGISI